MTISVRAQQPTASPVTNEDVNRLKHGFADAINKNADLQQKLSAANDALDATKKDADNAKTVVALDNLTIDALHKALDASKMAEDAYKRAYDAEQTASDAYKHRAESAEVRIDKLTDQLSKARKHGTLGTILGILAGAVMGRF